MVCICNIATIFTSKMFPVSFANMQTRIASFIGVCRRDNNQLHTTKQTFVSQILSELVKTPTIQFCLLCFAFVLCSKSYFAQILNSNAFVFCFSFCYYLLCNRMVIDRNEASFFPAKPFEQSTTAFCAFGLNGRSHFRIFFTNFFKLFGIIRCGRIFGGRFWTNRYCCFV